MHLMINDELKVYLIVWKIILETCYYYYRFLVCVGWVWSNARLNFKDLLHMYAPRWCIHLWGRVRHNYLFHVSLGDPFCHVSLQPSCSNPKQTPPRIVNDAPTYKHISYKYWTSDKLSWAKRCWKEEPGQDVHKHDLHKIHQANNQIHELTIYKLWVAPSCYHSRSLWSVSWQQEQRRKQDSDKTPAIHVQAATEPMP